MTAPQNSAAGEIFQQVHQAGSLLKGWGAVFSLNLHPTDRSSAQHLTRTRALAAPLDPPVPTIIPRPDGQPGFAVIMAPASRPGLLKSARLAQTVEPVLMLGPTASPAGTVALSPNDIAARVVSTPSGGSVLDVFIATNGQAAPSGPIADAAQLPLAEDAAWTLMLSGQHVFSDVIADSFNARSQHIKLQAMAPEAGDTSAWFVRSVHRVLFQGSISWGDDPPILRQHTQLGFDLRGDPAGNLAVSTYQSAAANIDPQISVDQRYALTSEGAAGSQQLRLVGTEPSLTGEGLMEHFLVPIAQGVLGQEFKTDIEAVPFTSCTDLLANNIQIPDGRLFIRNSGIPGDMVLIGEIVPV